VRINAPSSLTFRRAARSGIEPADKPIRRRRFHRISRKHDTDSGDATFECTPFGRRRKRLLRPATFLRLGLLAGFGGLACWYLF
jgi:hypothetical protein